MRGSVTDIQEARRLRLDDEQIWQILAELRLVKLSEAATVKTTAGGAR
jgi:hypothetical protein